MVDLDRSVAAAEKFRSWADGFLNFEKTPKKNMFWLETMVDLCARLGNPQDSCRCFHVAGSKGKGSVSEMIASILGEAGYFTGIYSSPHIIDFAERVRCTGGYFDETVYRKAADSIIGKLGSVDASQFPGGRPVTWFELVTLFGMECFREAGCHWAVYEVGLGGRLDATNVVRPECCCINRIEKEHTEYLGDTLELIAREKGGIIKSGIPVVVGRQPGVAVENELASIASGRGSEIVFAEKASSISSVVYKNIHTCVSPAMNFTLSSEYFSRPLEVSLKMLGDCQSDNASVAALAVKRVFPDLDEGIIERGLSRACLPGRFEILDSAHGVDGVPFIVLDGAHTPRSVSLTVETLGKVYGDGEVELLFACASDKEVETIAEVLSGRFSRAVLTIPGQVKSSDLSRAESAFGNAGIDFTALADYKAAIRLAIGRARRSGAPLLVTGSFYLVSEVKRLLKEQAV